MVKNMHYFAKRIKMLSAIAAILISFMVLTSFAYWTQELQASNEYRLGKYNTELVDEFTSPSDWQPGIEVDKKVSVKNSGTVPVYVKIVLNQQWMRNIVRSSVHFPLTFDGVSGEEFAAKIALGRDVVLLDSGKSQRPSLSLNLPSVDSASEAQGKWLLVNETPDTSGNYTLYYIGTLDRGETTPFVVDSVRMNPNLNASILEQRTVWNNASKLWETQTVNNPTHSYEDTRYSLTVTMHTVQATPDAIAEVFSSSSTIEQSIISYLQTIGFGLADLSSNHDDKVGTHMLYFEEKNGLMEFTPVRGNDEYWFMSQLNMIPGGNYEHVLEIENRSKEPYDLYMQAIPLQQDAKLNQLLEHITMKVFHGSDLIYDGTALGKEYPGSLINLQNVIYLGEYTPGHADQIQVALTLDKDTHLEYSNLLTKIDWKFMVEGQTSETITDPDNPNPEYTESMPKTGDSTNFHYYLAVMLLSLTCLIACAVGLRKARGRLSL
jgi:alternate signal-mediated exported protein, CPF_0494 family